MDSLEPLTKALEGPETTKKTSKGKKRKWREIEALKDKYRLKRELEELDYMHEIAVEELQF